MKTLVEIDENLTEDEVIIRCRKFDDNISKIQKAISDISSQNSSIVFYDGNKEFYFDVNLVLFFETELNFIYAYTKNNVYKVKHKLYELEEKLPRNFLRISKSTILNINQVFSISHTFGSSNLVEFYQSPKQVYVSRHFYKELKERLKERK